jgi:cyclomaltodextrinase / maltogenic alpha-amylase / neopullulanase
VTDLAPAWVADAAFYQIFPDRFARSGRVPAPGPLEPWEAPPTVHGFKGGDLYGVAERLDELVDLGISAIYLNPVFASASNHRYHTYDYMAVDPLLGGDAALRELLDRAHGRGVRVILDGAFNHVGRGFWPFHHVLEAGRHSPYRGWFHLSDRVLNDDIQLRAYPGATLQGPLDAEWCEEHGAGTQSLELYGYRSWWDLPALPKLNTDAPEVRSYLMGVAEHWIAFGADGWRLDVPEEIDDPTFWAEFRARVRAVNPEAYLLGEVWRVAPDWTGLTSFDGLMNYPLAVAVLGYVAGDVLDRSVVAQHGALSRMLVTIDASRFAGRIRDLTTAYPPGVTHLNVLGTHDMPRVRTLCGNDEPAVRMAMLLATLLPGAPSIYYGDEIGMAGDHDPGCRAAYPPAGAVPTSELRGWLRELLQLRSVHASLRSPVVEVAAAEGMACAVRRGSTDPMLLVVNAGRDPHALAVAGLDAMALEPVFGTDPARLPPATRLVRGAGTIDLPARAAAVVRLAT